MTSSNIFAGSDTTAASARAVVYFLLKHTQHKENLVEELQTAYREGRLSQIAQRSEVEQLPFLMACVYESLRMHPQPGMNLPRIVPAGGLNVSGFFLPMNVSGRALPICWSFLLLTFLRPLLVAALGSSTKTRKSSVLMPMSSIPSVG